MRWVLGLILGFGLVVTASAEVPQQLHYNGYLTNAVGEAVDCPDTIQCALPLEMSFRLYDSEEGGTPLWTQLETSVPIYQGSFHVVLGKEASPLNSELFDGPLWLAVKVDGQVEMSPRQSIVSAAYAIKAGTVDYAENAAQLGGLNPEDFASTESVAELQTIVDGADDDTLAAMGCAPGQVAKASEAGWICADAAESDTTLSETQVDEMVANNDYAIGEHTVDTNTQLTEAEVDSYVAGAGYVKGDHFSGSWEELSDVPAGLADGDDTLSDAEVLNIVSSGGYLGAGSGMEGFIIKAGRASQIGNGGGQMDISVSFGTTFASAPFVVASPTINGVAGDEVPKLQVLGIGTTGTTVRLRRTNGFYNPATTFHVDWIAIGPAP
jgi:hypothetical protein